MSLRRLTGSAANDMPGRPRVQIRPAGTAADLSTPGFGEPQDDFRIQVERAGERVATRLRKMILDGQLKDGDTLPRQEDLLRLFQVSHPSLREGLRMLEAEGLITIRRGKIGGSTVRVPQPANVAFALGMVLQAEKATLNDLAVALDDLEPICFALAARRPDRSETLVPLLEASCDRQESSVDDYPTFTAAALEFHQLVVEHCGNVSIKVAVGAMTRLWSHHEVNAVVRRRQPSKANARKAYLAVVETHRALTGVIAAGEADRAKELSQKHLGSTQHYSVASTSRVLIDVSDLPIQHRNQ
jgi:GntR family transcriptional regulator, transcriptional repressor for pyruvate dehydrogenase complex